MPSRSKSSKGAVRLKSKRKPRPFRLLSKVSLAASALVCGFLITTHSNGTIDSSKPAQQMLSSQLPPTFSFNDHGNALDDRRNVQRTAQVGENAGKIQRDMATPDTVNSAATAGTSAIASAIVSKPSIQASDSVNQSTVQLAAFEVSDQSMAHPPPTPVPANMGSTASPADNILAMNLPLESAALKMQSSYKTQQPDIQAGQSETARGLSSNPFVERDTTPTTRTISPLANHPSIATIRKNVEFPDGATTETIVVSAGDTLSKLLNDRGVKIEQMPQLLTDDVIRQYLSNLDIGQTFQVVQLANGEFHSLSAKVGDEREITIRRSETGFATASIDLPLEKERVVTSGTIEQSLYVAADLANLKQSTIMELSDIFQWELDFARDIRKGDQFSLIYDRLYRDGKYIGDGDILAAEFVRGGKHYQAIRYTDPDGITGYYSPDGKSKRRTFLRHPVDVVRITSKFNPNRLHPVLHQIRAHKGVDYGAPTGTPVRATADGTVRFSDNKSAYGKTIILSHGTDIRTLYAHLSRISDKVANGKKVKQGDVIGYVGATGRVTGAHLHYEFQKNGDHVDPLKVELPAAQPLKAELRDELRELSDDLLAQMRSVIADSSEPVVTAAAR